MADEPGDIIVTARVVNPNVVNISPGNNYFFYADNGAFADSNSMADAVLNGYFDVADGAPSPDDEGEIVVAASKEQVDAAMLAFDAAGVNLTITKYLGIIAAGLVSKIAGIALELVDETIDMNKDSVQEAYADLLYWQDGADGTYDGYAHEMGEYQSFFPGSSVPGGPKTPPMPSELNTGVGNAEFRLASNESPGQPIQEATYDSDILLA